MPTDRYFIAPYDANSGLQNNFKPFAIPDTAFAELNNAYVFRGRVRKRFGSKWFGNTQLLSRLRYGLGTNANTAISLPVNTTAHTPQLAIGQMFSLGNDVFTVYQLGAGVATLTTSATVTASINSVANPNTITFTGGAASTVYWYPALPVMGLITFENNSVNNEPVIGFDTEYAYIYNNGWDRLAGEITPGAATWTGSDSEFFWGETWTSADAFSKILFVTNFNENEPNFMRVFDGTNWDNFQPLYDASNRVNSCRIIVVFKNRLLLLNTWEGASSPGNNYVNRVRYSQIGSPLDANAFRQDIPGKGNGVDAPTTEAIVTVEFVKDRLIVFFERSTWELVYTGNQITPFVWQKINTELGVESTFSVVPFDKVAIGVGQQGIHASTGANVERIDNLIPDETFQIRNAANGTERVYGIRDYYVEQLYFTLPELGATDSFPYPNRVLVYNYNTATWAFNDDSITAFGYYQPQTGITWSSTTVGWTDSVKWGGGPTQSLFRQVVAGNQEGYTFIVDSDEPTNASVIQITNLSIPTIPPDDPSTKNLITITAVNHNFRQDEYIYLSGITSSGMGHNLETLNNQIFQIVSDPVLDDTPNSFTIQADPHFTFVGTYSGGGVISRVSQIDILTKQYNFYQSDGRNAYISKVDFLVDRTALGQILVNYYISTSPLGMVNESDSSGTNSLVGTSVLETSPYPGVTIEQSTDQFWHTVYFQADGQYIQLRLILNDAQMLSTDVRSSPFVLYSMCIYATPTSSRFNF